MLPMPGAQGPLEARAAPVYTALRMHLTPVPWDIHSTHSSTRGVKPPRDLGAAAGSKLQCSTLPVRSPRAASPTVLEGPPSLWEGLGARAASGPSCCPEATPGPHPLSAMTPGDSAQKESHRRREGTLQEVRAAHPRGHPGPFQ